MWACLGLDTADNCELYLHHSIRIYPDGRLIGQTISHPFAKIDVPDVKQIVEKWEKSLKVNEKGYWDDIEEGTMNHNEDSEDSDEWDDIDDSEDEEEDSDHSS
jgi:hypothetical protein